MFGDMLHLCLVCPFFDGSGLLGWRIFFVLGRIPFCSPGSVQALCGSRSRVLTLSGPLVVSILELVWSAVEMFRCSVQRVLQHRSWDYIWCYRNCVRRVCRGTRWQRRDSWRSDARLSTGFGDDIFEYFTEISSPQEQSFNQRFL